MVMHKSTCRIGVLCLALLLSAFTGAVLPQDFEPSDSQSNESSGIGKSKPGSLEKNTFLHDGRMREYFLYLPASYEKEKTAALLWIFHGGAGKAEKIATFTGFMERSDRNGFIAVYPQGINSHWNDGRDSEKFREQTHNIDDVGFVLALLKKLKSVFLIDEDRVFATGLSNGGMFSHRLALEASEHFAAVAPVIGGIPEALAKNFNPEKLVSILIMNGTEDPFVPYDGGDVVVNLFPNLPRLRRPPSRGKVIPTDVAIRLWLTKNQIDGEPKVDTLPDVDPEDGTTVERSVWSDEERKLSVVLYRIIGGGHTYPGGEQYLPERTIGKTCRDFNAAEVIWDFFSEHGR